MGARLAFCSRRRSSSWSGSSSVDAPVVRFLVRLYRDKYFLRDTVAAWGWLAPLVFIGIQALQVIVSPIPGEITGPVGGALFGTTWGLIYSTIGLTIGTLICFGLGRLWGEPLIRPWLSEHNWNRMNFIIEAEGAILCFILYLIPGLPEGHHLLPVRDQPDALLAVRGRVDDRRASPAPGSAPTSARTSASSSTSRRPSSSRWSTAACLPLYYYRDQIVRRFQRKPRPGSPKPSEKTS